VNEITKKKKKTDGLNNQSTWLPDAWNHLQRTVNKRDNSFDDLFTTARNYNHLHFGDQMKETKFM
jgi:hypothetical protein